MASSTKKRPPLEAEAGEGKLHEQAESPEEEVREGAEPDDAPKGKAHSRKRSPKGAKNTKAPMDGDCGCGGKKGSTCDGNCGGYAKKDRNDALTPQEYLAACDLGIQGRSRSYIRARLDAAQRLDLKCGAGAISEGEKCTKGAAQKVESPVARKAKNVAKAALVAGAVIGGVAAGKAALNNVSNKMARRNRAELTVLSRERQSRWRKVWETNAAANKAEEGLGSFRFQKRAAAQLAYQEARNRLEDTRALQRSSINRIKRFAPKSEARKRAARRRDSIYASGFSPDLAQLTL